jgi:hypothetical protein
MYFIKIGSFTFAFDVIDHIAHMNQSVQVFTKDGKRHGVPFNSEQEAKDAYEKASDELTSYGINPPPDPPPFGFTP